MPDPTKTGPERSNQRVRASRLKTGKAQVKSQNPVFERHKFTDSLDAVFQADGIRILASPPQAPRANVICERIIGALRREVLDRLPIVNEHHLRQVLTGYLLHYNTARPHRTLGQLAPDQAHTRPPRINLAEHRIRRKQVLSGLTSEYQIAA
jgi:putative transposase